jgi:hypothetical protein
MYEVDFLFCLVSHAEPLICLRRHAVSTSNPSLPPPPPPNPTPPLYQLVGEALAAFLTEIQSVHKILSLSTVLYISFMVKEGRAFNSKMCCSSVAEPELEPELKPEPMERPLFAGAGAQVGVGSGSEYVNSYKMFLKALNLSYNNLN